MPMAHRAMTALAWRIVIAEILRQAITQATVGGEQLEHGVDPRDFTLLVPGEIGV
nr:hypothetical protein GCM10020185_28410 [Pseudomonas brassicacearum subsp. brassicacearum]